MTSDEETTSQDSPRAILEQCLQQIVEGDGTYRAALLRETNLAKCINDNDIDLLIGQRHARALCEHAFRLTRQGTCAIRLQRRGPDKRRLTVLSPDLSDRVEIDLWSTFRQIDRGRAFIGYNDIEHTLTPGAGVCRMPLELEAAIYVHHLATKKKNLRTPATTSRLVHYRSSCAQARHADLSAMFAAMIADGHVSESALDLSRRTIERLLGRPPRRTRRVLRAVAVARLLQPDVKNAVALIGCDGVGKSGIGGRLAGGDGAVVRGKAFYRRSLPFRAAYKFNKATLKLSSERVDDLLATMAYACARWRMQGVLPSIEHIAAPYHVIDRYLGDFLYRGRKTDRPRFARLARLMSWRQPAMPVVHLVAPYAVLAGRKQEISPRGHEHYDFDMFGYYWHRGHDYAAYCNVKDLSSAVRALRPLISDMVGPTTPTLGRPLAGPVTGTMATT